MISSAARHHGQASSLRRVYRHGDGNDNRPIGDSNRIEDGNFLYAAQVAPLSPCGRGCRSEAEAGEGELRVSAFVAEPSPGATRHLLPKREKERNQRELNNPRRDLPA